MQREIDRRWLKGTARVLTGVAAAVMNAEPRSLRKLVANAVVAKVGAAGASYGAFGVASLIGTAQTGTAIGTLSGAAANSATLAWLGFGSMAVGTFVLPAVMVAGGFLLLKVWKGKARQPDSLSANGARDRQCLHGDGGGLAGAGGQRRDPVEGGDGGRGGGGPSPSLATTCGVQGLGRLRDAEDAQPDEIAAFSRAGSIG